MRNNLINYKCFHKGRIGTVLRLTLNDNGAFAATVDFPDNGMSEDIIDPVLLASIGITNDEGHNIYEGDVMEFENGDRFVVRCEENVQFYVDWIGDPEFEDQARDLYRISSAVILGSSWLRQDLLEE